MALDFIVKCIVAFGVVIGGLDYLTGTKFGIGEKFREAFEIAGSTMLSMIGIMSIAPTLAVLFKPVAVPAFRSIGVDPSALGMFLACDMGGYQLAQSLADSPLIAQMFGMNAASIIGGTIVFAIPFGMAVIPKEQHQYFYQGTLIALMTAPVGTGIAGVLLDIDIMTVLVNLIPVSVISFLILLGFVFSPGKMTAGAKYFGRGISTIGVASIVIGFVSFLTGKDILPGYTPIMVNMKIVCGIVIFLAGAMPIMGVLTRVFHSPLARIGSHYGLIVPDTVGLAATIASNVPMFVTVHSMSNRGTILNSAWGVTAAGLLGGQTSLVLSVAPESLGAFLAGKGAASVLALVLGGIWIKVSGLK